MSIAIAHNGVDAQRKSGLREGELNFDGVVLPEFDGDEHRHSTFAYVLPARYRRLVESVSAIDDLGAKIELITRCASLLLSGSFHRHIIGNSLEIPSDVDHLRAC